MTSFDICTWQCALNSGASPRLSQQGVDRTWRGFSVTVRVALLSTEAVWKVAFSNFGAMYLPAFLRKMRAPDFGRPKAF
jgi:hypothetical protein